MALGQPLAVDCPARLRYYVTTDPEERRASMDRSTTCCFTGHRPNRLPWGEREDDPRCLALKEQLRQAVE